MHLSRPTNFEVNEILKSYLVLLREGIMASGLSITFTENQLRLVLNRLDMVRLEFLRLRVALLPEKELSEEEKRGT